MPDLDLSKPLSGQDESGRTSGQRAAVRQDAAHRAGAKKLVDELRKPGRAATGVGDYIANGRRPKS